MAKCCSTIKNPCPSYPNAACVVYTGANLTCSEIKTNDRLDTILEKIDEKLCAIGAGTYLEEGDYIDITGSGTEFNPFVISVDASSFWLTTGNSGTVPTTNFVGTTDAAGIAFRVNNTHAGAIGLGTNVFGDYEGGLVALGYRAAQNLPRTTKAEVVAIGANTLQDYLGYGNAGHVAVGTGALRNAVTNERTTAVGEYAGFQGVSGDHHAWFGAFAGEVTAGGAFNTGLGAESMRGIKAGSYNSAFGGWSLYRSTGVVSSVTITNGGSGYTSATCTFSAPDTASPGTLSITATGTVTVAAGAVTGITITNPGSGYSTDHNPVTVTITGDGTGATGTVVLNQSTGNTAGGFASGMRNRSGDYNVYLGYLAGYAGDTNPPVGADDDYCIYIGSNANRDSAVPIGTKLTNAIAIGAYAEVSTSNTLILGGTTTNQVNVGIGAKTARKYLDVVGSDILVHELTIGRGAGSVVTNTVLGYQALAANTTGFAKVAIGYQALNADTTTAAGEVGIGYQAMGSMLNPSQSVAIGYRAMYGSGSKIQRQSIAIGTHAMENAAAAGGLASENNIAIGQNSLFNLTTGYNNTMVGWGTGTAYTTQAYNTGLGLGALYQATGEYQIGIGISTLASNSGNASIGIGYYAGYSSTTASNGIYIGYRSGFQITTGNYNVIIGGHEGASIATSDNNVLIADGQGNQRLLINGSGAYSIGGGFGSSGQVLTSNGSGAAPTWQNAPGSGTGSTITTDSFDATTDWGSPSGGYYSYAFAHALGTNDYLIQIWDDTGTPVATTVQIEQTNTNTVTLKVTETPDNRFAGRIVIVSL